MKEVFSIAEFEIILKDDGDTTGLARLPFFRTMPKIADVKYKECSRPGEIQSCFRKGQCNCCEKQFFATPFSKYDVEQIKRAVLLGKSLVGNRPGVKLYYPITRPAPLIILLPPDYVFGVFIREIEG